MLETQGDKPAKRKFKAYPIGYCHIDIAELHTAEGKLYLFVAIDRTSKFAYAERHDRAGKMIAGPFLRALVAAVPHGIHMALTDNGIQCTTVGQIGTRLSLSPIASAEATALNIGSSRPSILGRTGRLNG